MPHVHCQCGQISWNYDVMVIYLVSLHMSWKIRSPSTHLTFLKKMTFHYMNLHISWGIQTLSTFLTTTPWQQVNHIPSSSFLPAGRRTIQGWNSEKIQFNICCRCFWDLAGFVHDVQVFWLLSSGARYLVVMVVCHRVERNQKFHWAPHKVESSLNYSEVGIII